MKNTGKEFEKLAHRVFTLLSLNEAYTSVEHNVNLISQDGPRQFDVVIRSKVSGLDLLTVIECRDFNKNLSIAHVDGLHSKAKDVNANKAVLVAKKGFSQSAKKKADRLGITLFTAHDFANGINKIGLQVPFVFIAVDKVFLNVSFLVSSEIDVWVDSSEVFINDCSISKIFEKEYKEKKINSLNLNELINWDICFSSDDEICIKDVNGIKLSVSNLNIQYNIVGHYYFGYLNDLPGSMVLNNISQSEVNILFNSKEIIDNNIANLKLYKYRNELPVSSGLEVVIIRNFDIIISKESFKNFKSRCVGKLTL